MGTKFRYPVVLMLVHGWPRVCFEQLKADHATAPKFSFSTSQRAPVRDTRVPGPGAYDVSASLGPAAPAISLHGRDFVTAKSVSPALVVRKYVCIFCTDVLYICRKVWCFCFVAVRSFILYYLRARNVSVQFTSPQVAMCPENVHALKGLACCARVAPASCALAAAPGLLAHALVTKQ
jgi:hypothetical protein